MLSIHKCLTCGNPDLISTHMVNDVQIKLRNLQERASADHLIGDSSFALCLRCELLFARNRESKDELESYYSQFPILQGKTYASYPPPERYLAVQKSFASDFADRLSKTIEFTTDMSVLGIRCESGAILDTLRQRYGITSLYGLEHFPSSIQYARNDLKIPNVEFLPPSLTDIPYSDHKFDLILSNHILTHAITPMKFLSDVRNMLAPGGTLILFSEVDHIHHLPLLRSYQGGVTNFHKQLLTQSSLTNMCAVAGLEATHIWTDEIGLEWASSKSGMTFIAKPNTPIHPDRIPPTDTTHFTDCITNWKQRERAFRRTQRWKPFRRRAGQLARGILGRHFDTLRNA
jgi:2-polyprenyl-3-methyl-5-hydroxy-6-metoxy-1,4-benzoquinol methylase